METGHPLFNEDPGTQEAPLSAEHVDALVEGKELPPEPAPSNPYEKYKFTANGKEIIPKDEDQMKQLMSKGHDYAQRMFEINQRAQKLAQYEQLDQWALKNPDKWQNIYAQAFTPAQPTMNATHVQAQTPDNQSDLLNNEYLKPLVEKINSYEEKFKYIDTLKSQAEQEQRRVEDQALQEEIKTLRESYKDIDFSTPDPDGKSLEFKIIEHGVKNNINSFKTAFKDFYHDDLIKLAETRAREAVGKEIQKNSRLGLLGEGQAPTKRSTLAVKNMSYDDLEREALKEYNLT